MNSPIKGVEAIRASLITPVKLQFPAPMAGFDQANSFGIYRNSGGAPLGVVGKQYYPPDPHLFLDLILQSIDHCADWLDLSKIEYSELMGGSRIRISIPTARYEIKKSPIVGDIVDSRADFTTGFDGLTKTRLSSFRKRLRCLNGATSTESDFALSFKNTKGNQGKWLLFCDELIKVMSNDAKYAEWLSTLATRQYTKKERDAFFLKVTGVKEADYNEQSTKMRNILDKINNAVAMEEQELGSTFYGLLNGITRYTTHSLEGGNMDGLMYGNSWEMNRDAHKAIQELVMAN